MTMPVPLGKKSLPTMFSRTDDLPADWEPITVNNGKSRSVKEVLVTISWSLFTTGISSCRDAMLFLKRQTAEGKNGQVFLLKWFGELVAPFGVSKTAFRETHQLQKYAPTTDGLWSAPVPRDQNLLHFHLKVYCQLSICSTLRAHHLFLGYMYPGKCVVCNSHLIELSNDAFHWGSFRLIDRFTNTSIQEQFCDRWCLPPTVLRNLF